MDNYAKILRHEGKYNQAEQLYQQSLELRERTLSADHSDIAASLNNLAILNLAEGHYSKAETDFRKSIHIMENDFGAAYPGMADYYHGYGFLMVAMGQTNEALSVGKKEKQAQETAFGTILSFASEMQRMEYQRTRQPYDLLATLGDANDLADEIMHTKGIVLDSLLEDAMTARESRNPEVNNTLKELNQYGRRLNELEIGLPQISDHKESLMLKDFRHELELQIENLQGRLSHEVTTFGRVRRALRITLPQVQSELTTDTMLVEFLRYNYYLGKTDFEPRYGAILIDHTNGPVWVSIGRACDIEHNLKDGEEMMRSRDRGNIAILKTLYSQLMKPVLELLPTNVTTLIISPDAELNFLSFATLVSPQDNFLAEQYRIKYVASGRDLVYGRTTTNINPELAVFADPDFNKSPDSPHLTNTNTVKLAMLSTDTRDYNGYSLLALPYTAQEAEFLRSCCPSWHLKAAIYTGIEAAENWKCP
jgi:tetratricopeptide (TPR) repeat protein